MYCEIYNHVREGTKNSLVNISFDATFVRSTNGNHAGNFVTSFIVAKYGLS